MIRHIVMWKFRPDTQGEQQRFIQGLRGLQGVVPQILRSEVGENVKDGNYDAVLMADFESFETLEAYLQDPRHKAVSEICKAIRIERTAVDYEI